MSYGSQDHLQLDHCLTSNFEQLHTYVTNTSCLSTLQPCHSSTLPQPLLTLSREGGFSSVGGSASHYFETQKLAAAHSEGPLCTYSSTQPNEFSACPCLSYHKASICYLDGAHLRGRFRAIHLKSSVNRSKVICIEIALSILSKILDINSSCLSSVELFICPDDQRDWQGNFLMFSNLSLRAKHSLILCSLEFHV